MYRTLALMPWSNFAGFYDPHLPNAFLKSTFQEVWKKEYDLLDATCRSRFREDTNVSQYLMRYWQLASSRFHPHNMCRKGQYYDFDSNNLANMVSAIEWQKRPILILNDGYVEDFEYTKNVLIAAFDKILPNKSSFEK